METLSGPALHGLSIVLGLVFGSFVTALSYRLPRGEDFIHGRSRCPHCRVDLTPADLLPVASWLLSGGRCRHCKVAVSWRYPAIELLCGGLFLVVSVVALPDQPARAVLLWVMAVLLLALSVIDLEKQKLPNTLVAGVALVSIGLTWVNGSSFIETTKLAAIVVCSGLLIRGAGQVFFGKPGIAWGDIKLGFAVALAIPFDSLTLFTLVLGVSALIIGIEYGWRRRADGAPFGPALCVAAFACLL